MTYHNLRILWSVSCGILGIMLLTLWVRSYYRADHFRLPLPAQQTLCVDSLRGGITWHLFSAPPHLHELEWIVGIIDTRDGWENYDSLVRPWHWIHMGGPEPEAYVIPHWFPFVIAASFAALPWLRYSLLTLLIAITLLGLILGTIIATTR